MSEPVEPRHRSIGRGPGLVVVGFSATLILLFGLANLVQPSTGGVAAPSGSASASVRASAAPGSPGEAVASGASPGSSPSGAPSSSPSSASPSGGPSSSTSASPSSSGDPVLVGAGDIADCDRSGDSETAGLIDGIAGTVFTAGDNAYEDGTIEQFRDCYGPTWGRFLARTRPAAGNHDWAKGDLAGYRAYFGAAAGPADASWYSYDLGTWHIVVLDSDCAQAKGCGPDSAQGRWLAADLKASSARCTLAVWHHPRFSSGLHGNDRSVAPLWDALYAADADVVVNGHDHTYERFAPQDPAGTEDRARGIREFVVGTGGADLYPFVIPVRNSELRLAVSHGVIRFTLHPGAYEWQFIPTTGDVGDAGSANCH